MLGATFWMMWKDHNREWRKWQLADRERAHWTIQAQLAQTQVESQHQYNELSQQLADAKRSTIDDAQIAEFQQAVRREDDRLRNAGITEAAADFSRLNAAQEPMQAAAEGSEEAARAREQVLDAMIRFVNEAKRRELALTGQRRFLAADLTAAVSLRGIAVGEGRPTEEHDANIQSLTEQIAEQDVKVVASRDYRRGLEAIIARAQATEVDLQKRVAAIEADINRLKDQMSKNRVGFFASDESWAPNLEPIVRGPILDAFNTGNIKLDQIWLPYMTINYNFSSVPRYDRCINCHRAIDKTAPGTATEPAYPAIPRGQRARAISLATPATAPEAPEKGASLVQQIEAVYGFRLADRGQVNDDDVTVQVVVPGSLAAQAGLMTADVITSINDGSIHTAGEVYHYLFNLADWGKPLSVTIRRGLDQPYTSHPRLDLFVGSTSPHKMGDMGCTICHDGQGSATEFKWSSHTPNDPGQAQDWARQYGWFDNHHWIFPMTSARFLESNCLKCHHDVVELEPSERFPQPPAPKLMEGYHLVREYGCYGCHEIVGFEGPNKRIGPDLRIEPNYSEVAKQLLQDPGLNESERGWAMALVERPEDKPIRDQLFGSLKEDAELATAARTPSGQNETAPAAPRLAKETHLLADGLKDVEVPGTYRKVGPSLRSLASKVEYDWLYHWIRRPADFRPTTRMPQFFGNHNHLELEQKEFTLHDEDGNAVQVTDLEYTRRFENIETRAVAEFLLAKSQPFEYIERAAGVTEAPDVERGRRLFETRGCLACHSHAQFPGINSNQGPDLSRLAAKFRSERGQRWLYSWLKQPNHYHPRTAMPNLFLEPIAETDPAGTPSGRVTDPAADIAAFLLSVEAQWLPEVQTPSGELTAQEARDLEDLTAVWLTPSFQSKRLAAQYARDGIPERIAGTVKVDEQVLVGIMTPEDRVQRQLEYVARRSISRYGCFGCHDIPGFETAKAIGTPLANWGRKDTSQLAFENIATFLETHGINGDQHPQEGHNGSAEHGLNPQDLGPDVGYFLQSLLSHQRIGFLWQKLRMPRAYDYETTVNKRYDERLRMPKFPFNDREREAVMTFVLGLTSETPDQRYVYKPDARRAAIVKGRQVLDKYNCAGCHVLEMERWNIAVEPSLYGAPPTTQDYPFVRPAVTPGELQDSLATDRRGLLHAHLYGTTAKNEETGAPQVVGEDGVPLPPDDRTSRPFYLFTPYQHAVVAGAARMVGEPDLLVPAKRGEYGPAVGEAYAGWGGDLAKYLYPRAIAREKAVNPAVVAGEAFGWLPPPLHHEGSKVQTDWLHDFLMDPIALRPAVMMRMPNFHMTSDEASKLVNYFAAQSNAEFPYEYNSRRRGGHLAQIEASHPGLLDDAMKIVTSSDYCVKCHSIGDYEVRGAKAALGPRLDLVYQRFRPDYLREWIAAPKRILPYTGMPANIPYAGGVGQHLFPGTSTQQLDGVVELLMNYDEYAKRRTSVRSLVRQPAPAGAPARGARPGGSGGETP
jgi:cytochrome c2